MRRDEGSEVGGKELRKEVVSLKMGRGKYQEKATEGGKIDK